MTKRIGSDRESEELNIFTKNKVRQGAGEGWLTGLGPRPRLYSYRAKRNDGKSAERAGGRGERGRGDGHP